MRHGGHAEDRSSPKAGADDDERELDEIAPQHDRSEGVRGGPRLDAGPGPRRALEAWLEPVLDAALELTPGPVVVLGPSGAVVRANHAARSLLEAERDATLARIAARRRPRREPRRTRVSHELVSLEPSLDDVHRRARYAAERLELTAREGEVLQHLVIGASNRLIASELGCAEKTIEIHVSRILAATGCATRTAVVARFWMGTLDADGAPSPRKARRPR